MANGPNIFQMLLVSGNRACRTCRRGSSPGCPCQCRCRRRGIPAYAHSLYGKGALNNAAIRLSVHAPTAQQQCILGPRLLQNTNRKPRAGSRTRWSAWPYWPRKWPKRNEAVAYAASEAFARCLHHRYASVELLSVCSVVSRRNTVTTAIYRRTLMTAVLPLIS